MEKTRGGPLQEHKNIESVNNIFCLIFKIILHMFVDILFFFCFLCAVGCFAGQRYYDGGKTFRD
jgi:hypothetical protein